MIHLFLLKIWALDTLHEKSDHKYIYKIANFETTFRFEDNMFVTEDKGDVFKNKYCFININSIIHLSHPLWMLTHLRHPAS